MRWFYILVLTIALTQTVTARAADPTQAQAAVDGEKKNADRAAKTLEEKLAEYDEAHKNAKEDPTSRNKDGKLWSEVEKEKEKEVALAAKDKSNADAALGIAQDRMVKLKGDTEEAPEHQSQASSQSGGKSAGDKAKDKAMAEAMKQAAAQKQQEEQKQEEQKKDEQPKQEETKTAEKEKPAQTSNQDQEEQFATIPEDIKKSLEAPYTKNEESDSHSDSQSKESSSEGYDDIIKANNEMSAAKAKETADTLASLNAEKETVATSEAATETEKTNKPVTVNEYIEGVVAQNSTLGRSPASSPNRTATSGTATPRGMKGSSSSRLLNSIK